MPRRHQPLRQRGIRFRNSGHLRTRKNQVSSQSSVWSWTLKSDWLLKSVCLPQPREQTIPPRAYTRAPPTPLRIMSAPFSPIMIDRALVTLTCIVSLADRPRSTRTVSVDAAITPVVWSRRRHSSSVIRVGVALRCAAGSRRRALGHRVVAAIIISATSPGNDVHANGKSRIICLSLGLPSCQSYAHRQNRESQGAHRNLLESRYNNGALRQWAILIKVSIHILRHAYFSLLDCQ
jgi:hypothetical protein